MKKIKIKIKKLIWKFSSKNIRANRFVYKMWSELILKRRLRKQLSGLKNFKHSHSKKRILFPLIETNHYQIFHLLIIAKALELRGAEIKILICGQILNGCEIKSMKNKDDPDPCWKCRYNEKNLLSLFNLNVIKIKDVLSKKEIDEVQNEAKKLTNKDESNLVNQNFLLKQCIEDSVVRYFYGRIPDELDEIKKIRVSHTETALISHQVIKKLEEIWAPEMVLSNMTSYSAWEPFYNYYKKNNSRFTQISMSQFELNSVIFNAFDLFPSANRYLKYKESRSFNYLDANENFQLNKFLDQRKNGTDKLIQGYGYFDYEGTANKLEGILKIDKSKRNIFLFSNLYWDIGLSDRKLLFDNVVDWVLMTIRMLVDQPNCHLYIKPHPAEKYGSSGSMKGISEIIKENFPNGIKNLTVIDPELRINTYQLFPYIDLGVIYTGTLGLEMMLSDVPVISVGTTSHYGLGFSIEPSSLGEYQDALIGNVTKNIDKRELSLYAYFYFLKTVIPWKLTEQVYGNNFSGFEIKNLNDLLPGKDNYLDHLCDCILGINDKVPENW